MRHRAYGSARGHRAAGFSMIELLVAITIVGILMAIAVASYDFAMVKTRRGAAKACLANGAQFMERYYTTHFTYEDAVLPACSDDVTEYYAVGFSGTPGDTFTIQAVPNASQDDSKCGTLSIDNTGTKGANDVEACW